MRIRYFFVFMLMLMLFAVPASADFVLPADLTEIGEEAFANDESITGVLEIPEGVTSIGAGAFQGCGGITGLVLPESLVEIGENAFAECDGLETVLAIHKTVNIHENAFAGNSKLALLRYGVKDDGTVEIVSGWQGSAHDSLTIPEMIDGYHVTEIASEAFANNTSIAGTVEIPEGVTSIGSGAFQGCSGMTGLVLPESINAVGESAFAECTELEGFIYIRKDISLHFSVFRNAPKLSVYRYEVTDEGNVRLISGGWIREEHSALTLPKTIYGCSVTEIGDYAFASAPISELVIPGGVISIGSGAFDACQKLVSVVLPDGLKNIAPQTFRSCISLNTISIPSSVESIGDYAFERCVALSQVTLAEGVVNIGGYAFAYTNISSIDLPDSATNINWDGLFLGCTQLTQLELPNNIETITWELFNNGEGSEYITELILPESVVAIEESALSRYFHFVNKLTVSKNMVEIGGFGGMYKLETVIIPEDSLATAVADWAFAECFNLKNISLPQNITKIGDAAFSRCHSLNNIVFPEALQTIGFSAFRECDSFISIRLPDSVVTIGDEAFAGCSFQEIILSKSLITIGNYAFESCYNLTDIDIPDSVTAIGESAFLFCQKLKNVTFSEGLISIGNSAFAHCSALSDIVIPDQVTEIGSSAFRKCTSLVNVSLPKAMAILDGFVFDECTSLTSIVIPDSVTTIYERAFHGCTNLRSVVLPSTLTSIPYKMFEGCTSLSSITLPDSITVIGAQAFLDCTGLVNITLPRSLTTICGQAFANCSSLTGDLVIPDSVTLIESKAFQNCSSLNGKLVLPNSLTSIGDYAFANCTNLSIITFAKSGLVIGDYAFQNCTGLMGDCILPSGSTITAQSFAGCSEKLKIYHMDSLSTLGYDMTVFWMDSVPGIDNLMGNAYANEQSIFHDAVFDLVSIVNLNLDELWDGKNRYFYLFNKALEANNSLAPLELMDSSQASSIQASLDTIKDSDDNVCTVLEMFCGGGALDNWDAEYIKILFKTYSKGDAGSEWVMEKLYSRNPTVGECETVLKSFMALSDMRLIFEVAEGLSNANIVYTNCVDVYNQLRFLEAMDEQKLKETARVYLQSNDSDIRSVGRKLMDFVEASKVERITMIITGKLADLGVEALVDGVLNLVEGKVNGVFMTTVKLTNAVINGLTNVDQVPKLVSEIKFSAEAATAAYHVFQSDLAAFKSNENDTNFYTAAWSLMVYADCAALAEDAYANLYHTLDDSILINLDDNVMHSVEVAEDCSKQYRQMNERVRAYYEAYIDGKGKEMLDMLKVYGYID